MDRSELTNAASHLDVCTLGRQQHMFFGLNLHSIVGAGHSNGFVCGDLRSVRLRFATDFAAGCVQLDAGFLIGFFGITRFAVSKESKMQST